MALEIDSSSRTSTRHRHAGQARRSRLADWPACVSHSSVDNLPQRQPLLHREDGSGRKLSAWMTRDTFFVLDFRLFDPEGHADTAIDRELMYAFGRRE